MKLIFLAIVTTFIINCVGDFCFEKFKENSNIYFSFKGQKGVVFQYDDVQNMVFFDETSFELLKALIGCTFDPIQLFFKGGDDDAVWNLWNEAKNANSMMTEDERHSFQDKFMQLKWQYRFVVDEEGEGTGTIIGFIGTDREWKYEWDAPGGAFDRSMKGSCEYFQCVLEISVNNTVKLINYWYR